MQTNDTNKKPIAYWTVTALLLVMFTGGGVTTLVRLDGQVETMLSLGVPLHVMTLLGIWKLLAVVAIGAPRLPRLKEWAYAGLFFDVTGAIWMHTAAGHSLAQSLPPLVGLLLVVGSSYLRPPDRRL